MFKAIPLKNGEGERSFCFRKSGISPPENQYFSTFQIPKNRAVSTVLLVFFNVDFH